MSEHELKMFEIKEKEQEYEIIKNAISKCNNLDMNGVEKLLKILNPSQNSQQQNNMIPQQQPIPFIYNNNPMMNPSYQQPMNQPFYQPMYPQFHYQ